MGGREFRRELKGTVSRDRYFCEGLKHLTSPFCVYAPMVFKVFKLLFLLFYANTSFLFASVKKKLFTNSENATALLMIHFLVVYLCSPMLAEKVLYLFNCRLSKKSFLLATLSL
jgi:hypothetical protein